MIRLIHSYIHTSRIQLLIYSNGSWRENFLKCNFWKVSHVSQLKLQGQHWKRRSFHLRHGPNQNAHLIDLQQFRNSQILHVELEPVRFSWCMVYLFVLYPRRSLLLGDLQMSVAPLQIPWRLQFNAEFASEVDPKRFVDRSSRRSWWVQQTQR